MLVAGMGAVTAHGGTVARLWDAVRHGRVGIRPVRGLVLDGYRTSVGGELPPAKQGSPPSYACCREPVVDVALTAATEAMTEAAWVRAAVPAYRFGVVIGTCNAGLLSARKWYVSRELGDGEVPAEQLLLAPPQALAEVLASHFTITGPAIAINTACAASANAIGYAADLIRTGAADAVLVGGADVFSDVLFAGFNSLESLSPEPAKPYSGDRQGLSLGEGSGMLVLVRGEIAQDGGRCLAEVLGYGLSADGYHVTAPDPTGRGAARAIASALRRGAVDPADVGYVNGHGTGTPKNDAAESVATRRALGEAADKVAVSSTKSMVGHLLGAAGVVETIVTIKALQEQLAPPTAGWSAQDPVCDLDYVPNVARPMTTDVALSNNFAFAGANACLALARTGCRPAPTAAPTDRVVITGIAALTPAGCTVGALRDLAAGVGTESACVAEGGNLLGRVEFDPAAWLTPRERRRMDRLTVLSVVAAKQALADAGLDPRRHGGDRIGVIVGTGLGPMESMEGFARPVIESGPGAANPAVFPNTVYNAAGGQVAMHTGAVGPASTMSVLHASGAAALGYAQDLLEADQADAIVCIGVDVLTASVVRGYAELGLLARTDRPGEPRGLRLAEAGVALVLERASAAASRAAEEYGELVGHAITGDARGLVHPDPDGVGLERAMSLALARGGVPPERVTAVWAAAAGLPRADAGEARAVARLLPQRPVVHRPKLRVGEPIGAGGSLLAVLALLSWRVGAIAGPVLVNSSSLGGTHIALALRPTESEGNHA
ncbi:beta-ketoacyl-[acyl-carrier-protein] synthase family protein [Solihabitans fulvus]|uniref:beta-ketoacyl-[acyl-carrier-protein] synthase family protein n=1 Tax=Solihabitans fulvus TaxID=1892852 RepID=UPI001F0A55E1|nr:beta-ketoacyl-[acyl-carrier-protein] synthase family protein [Solihabitans fulvus]